MPPRPVLSPAPPTRGVRPRPAWAAGLLLGALVACNPWRDVHEAELVWHDAGRIEAELGLRLTPLSASAPIGPWPRIVLRADRVDVDNRAWFLSLPDAYFLAPGADVDELAEPLKVQERLLSLEKGRLDPSDLDGMLVPALYETLRTQAEQAREMSRLHGAEPFGGHLTVVAEPDIPLETLSLVLNSAAQAGFGSWMMAGRSGDRLEAALAGPPTLAKESAWRLRTACQMSCRVHLGDGRARAVCGELPPIAAQPGCAGELELLDALARLHDRCLSRWEADPPEAALDSGPPENCIQLQLYDEGLTYQELVDEMAAVHVHFPALRQPYHYSSGTLGWQAERAEACAVALHPDELTETQLDVVCGSTGMLGGPRYIASDGGSSASAAGSVHDLPLEHAAAFPAYADWYAAQLQAGPQSDEARP